LKNQTSGLTYQAASLDFSSIFREHVAEHKNLWGILKNQTSGLTYQAASLDFSSVFREHVAEHKNLWGILKKQTPASMGIPISSISFSEMLVICP
jgi:hypothetical protein